MKRTPLRRISKKRAKVQRQRARMVSEELAKRELCEAFTANKRDVQV